jgi:uncharacterized protein (DUF2235 family)
VTDRKQAQAMADHLFTAVKAKEAKAADRRGRVQATLQKYHHPAMVARVPVMFLGLWDTVEAMGNPLAGSNPYDLPSKNYGDQLCNVTRAAHALSADDNRNRSYRPVLLTGAHLLADCPDAGGIDAGVSEVWFTGDHSDIGGKEAGKHKNRQLGGVTLNWMLAAAAPFDLLPGHAPFPQTPDAVSGNGQDSLPDGKAQARAAAIRLRTADRLYRSAMIDVPASVLLNLEVRPRAGHEFEWGRQLPRLFPEGQRQGPISARPQLSHQ